MSVHPFSAMIAYGFDLAGPSHPDATAGVRLALDDGELLYRDHRIGLSDDDILEFVRNDAAHDDVAVGLDAPLSYQPGGGDRPADSRLRDDLVEAGGDSSSVMPPTMTRMAYLTLRGTTIARLLGTLGDVPVVETHPTSALIFRDFEPEDVGALKKDRQARAKLVGALRSHVRELPDALVASDHLVAAAAAALAVGDWQRGEPAWFHPADPPRHPRPVVC
jgi:predicted nuclease with RNAse H fold